MKSAPIPDGITPPRPHEFHAGLHRPTKAAKPGVHAVSRGVLDGARRSVCGLIGRFIPTTGADWAPFTQYLEDVTCGDCIKRFGDQSALQARSFGEEAA